MEGAKGVKWKVAENQRKEEDQGQMVPAASVMGGAEGVKWKVAEKQLKEDLGKMVIAA